MSLFHVRKLIEDKKPDDTVTVAEIQEALGEKEQVKGEKVTQAKLTAEQVLEIRRKAENRPRGWSTDLAREYGVDPTAIRKIVHRYNWKHI